ncbi:FIG149030: hypothetical protein [hydrothermal vent metagenome]|uniref:DUF3375 domain-containing protein n=1 Tax=hydrothermal vent metagenome TaxID=652676 RepID=A0A1W1BEZ0_9ZZZZ
MNYEKLKNLQDTNRTLRLLKSDNFAFTLSFFYLAFVKNGKITLQHSEILSYLDDYLFMLNESYANAYPKEAKEYLDDFVSEKSGYLRKYHDSSDEALYELTPYTQKALEFVESLEKKEFVGSRSKFNIIFELLEELEFETLLDDKERIKELERKREALTQEIDAIRSKQDIRFDSARIKEHYMQIEEMVRKLKYDFSEIEYNFRALNATAMEKIAYQNMAKGEVLGSIFEIEDAIRESDQGKSFFAFWQLLSDTKRSDKLSKLLENLYSIESIARMDKEQKLADLKFSLLKNGEKVFQVSSRLIEQLRRFLDERAFVENRRILELTQKIEKRAIEIKQNPPKARTFSTIAGNKVALNSIFVKPLYQPKKVQNFSKELQEEIIEVDMESFYDIFYIDEASLAQNIQKELLHVSQIKLSEVIAKYPITKGIAELVAYISLAKNSQSVVLDERKKESIVINDATGKAKKIAMPLIIFVREI